MIVAAEFEENRSNFSTNQYRICSIRVVDGEGRTTTLFSIGADQLRGLTVVRFGESFRLQVDYECLLPELPDASCGVAAAFTRITDMEHIMYFNTNYPHSDEEMQSYYKQEFRKYIGRRGTVQAYIPSLQLKPNEYFLTVGILPNRPTHHEFYELHYLKYSIAVQSNGLGIPAAFYPNVKFKFEP